MSPHVLVVEDNRDSRKLITWLLEDEGYTFREASTAEQGLSWVESESFDIILMDISLPAMDGQEATRRLRSDPRFREIPIIAVTAHAVRGKYEEIMSSGVSALITKPIDEIVLLENIKSLLIHKDPIHG